MRLTQATGTAEREAAVEMVDDIPGPKQVTVGADKNYDAEAMVQQLRERKATPHVPLVTRSAREREVEESFGWMKTVGLLQKLRHRGLDLHLYGCRLNLVRRNLVIGSVPPRVVGCLRRSVSKGRKRAQKTSPKGQVHYEPNGSKKIPTG